MMTARLLIPVLCIWFGLSSSLRAEDLPISLLASVVGGPSIMATAPVDSSALPPALRIRQVSLNPALLASDGVSIDSSVRLDFFEDAIYTARVDRVHQDVNGVLTIRGRLDGFPHGTMILTSVSGRSLLEVEIPELRRRYTIRDNNAGDYYLIDVDKDHTHSIECNHAPEAPETDYIPLFVQNEEVSGNPSDPVIVDVMIVYTPAAASWAVSQGGILNVIAQAMAKSQLALDNSLTYLTLNLVHSALINYSESGDSVTDLERLTGTTDGTMDEVHTLRNTYAADLVSLFARVEDVGGIAWLLNSSAGRPELGFSLNRVQQVAWTYTVVHEWGHNMSLGHHAAQNFQAGPGGIYSYSAGWRWQGADNGYYCSVMSYESGYYFSDGRDHARVAHFSNPSVNYQGAATGNAVSGDNARALRETKAAVSSYRSGATTLLPPNGVSASDGLYTNKVQVTWNTVANATFYKLFRNTSNTTAGAAVIGTPATPPYDDTTAEPGIVYYYWLTSRDGGTNESAFSAVDTGFRLLAQSLVPPTGVSASDGTFPDKIVISWNAVPGVSLYKIYRNTVNNNLTATEIGSTAGTAYDDTTASAEIVYFYWVISSDGSFDSGFSASDAGYRSNQGKPGKPAWVDASDGVYEDRVRITWATTFGATHYRVTRTDMSAGNSVDISAWTTQATFDDFNTQPGQQHLYFVQAAADSSGTGVGTISSPDAGFRRLLPPSSVVASRGTYSDKIIVNWTPSVGATHYRVYRASSPNQGVVSPVSSWQTSTSFVNSVALSLQSTNYFYYSVAAATNSSGASPSDYSGEAIGHLGLPLNTPAAPVASDGTTTAGVQVTWTSVSGANFYRVWRSTSSNTLGATATTWTNTLAWLDGGGTPGTLYYYTIQAATDNAGSRASTNSPSDEGWRRIAAPLNVTASKDRTNEIRVSWSAPSGASRYRVARGSAPGGPKTNISAWVSGTSLVDSNLPVAVRFYYAVTASIDTNGSRASDVSEENVGWVALPGPEAITASDGTMTTHVAVAWTSVPGASHYGLYRATAIAGVKTNISGWLAGITNFNDQTAVPGVTYFYWALGAVDAQGTGGGVTNLYDDGWRALERPIVDATDGLLANTVLVAWDKIEGASHYRVYLASGDAWTELSPSWSTATSYSHTVASPGTDYWYAVQAAVNSSGNRASAMSESNLGWRALSSPTGMNATDGTFSNMVYLTWGTVSNGTHYQVYRADTLDGVYSPLTAWMASTNYNDETAYPGASYYYAVRAALNSEGYRAGFASSTNEGWRGLLPPSMVQASDDLYADRVQVTWQPVEGGNVYRVYRTTSTGLTSRAALGGWTNALALDDVTATPGVQYYYSVQAATGNVGTTGQRVSAYSDEDPGRRSLSEAAPGASDGTFSDKTRITWSSITGASRYRVWRAEGETADLAPLSSLLNTTTYDDFDVIPGRDYYYSVQAYADTNGWLAGPMGPRDSGWRSIPAPANVLVSSGEPAIRVAFGAVPGAHAYQVYRSPNTSTSNWEVLASWTNTLEIVDSSAPSGLTSYYWVQGATDNQGARAGAISASSSAWASLAAPATVNVSPGTNTGFASVTWIAPTNATHYKVLRRREGSAHVHEVTGWQTQTAFNDSSATPGVTYAYQVVAARSSAGIQAGPASAETTGWRALAPPSAPVAGDGTLAEGVRVEWMGVLGASHYRVHRGTTSNGTFSPISGWMSSLQYLDDSGIPGTNYFYAIEAAIDSAGLRASELSVADAGWRAVAKPAPVAASDGTFSNRVEVTWATVPGATHYRVYRAAVADGTRTALLDWTPDASFVDDTGAPGVEYIYEVLAAPGASLDRVGLYGARDTGYSLVVEVPQTAFAEWASSLGLTGDLYEIFTGDRDGDGLPNGLEFALGTNLNVAEPALAIKIIQGQPVAETFKQDAQTVGSVTLAVEASLNLMTNAWSLPVVHFFGTNVPPQKQQWRSTTPSTGAVYRIKATLR